MEKSKQERRDDGELATTADWMPKDSHMLDVRRFMVEGGPRAAGSAAQEPR